MSFDPRTRPVDWNPTEMLWQELRACSEETERFLTQELAQLQHFAEQRRQLAGQEDDWIDELRQTLNMLESAADRLAGDEPVFAEHGPREGAPRSGDPQGNGGGRRQGRSRRRR